MRTKSNGRKRTQRLRSLGPLLFFACNREEGKTKLFKTTTELPPHILQDGCQETLERRRGNLTDQA